MDGITRDVYVMRNALVQPIDYQQGTNAIPLIFYMRDFEIPSGAEASIYIKKPSGTEIYNSGEIDGNTLTFEVTTQMSAETGTMPIQVHITKNSQILNSFVVLFHVLWGPYSDNAIESTNEFTVLEALIAEAKEAIAAANTATTAAETAASSANTAASAAETATTAANAATSAAGTATATATTAAAEAKAATTTANSAASAAETAATKATEAASEAEAAAEKANAAAENAENLINDSEASESTTYSSEYISNCFSTLQNALGVS